MVIEDEIIVGDSITKVRLVVEFKPDGSGGWQAVKAFTTGELGDLFELLDTVGWCRRALERVLANALWMKHGDSEITTLEDEYEPIPYAPIGAMPYETPLHLREHE